MSNGGNDRDSGPEDGPCEPFFVKRPEVFERASPLAMIKISTFLSRLKYSIPRAISCQASSPELARIDQDVKIFKSSRENMEHVPDHSPCGRRDDSNPLGNHWNRFLAILGKKPLLLKFFL